MRQCDRKKVQIFERKKRQDVYNDTRRKKCFILLFEEQFCPEQIEDTGCEKQKERLRPVTQKKEHGRNYEHDLGKIIFFSLPGFKVKYKNDR